MRYGFCFCIITMFALASHLFKKYIKIISLFFISFFKEKLRFIFFAGMAVTINLNAQAEWVSQLGGAEGEIGYSTSADLSGHIYTIGTFSGTSTFGTYTTVSMGKGDIFITRAAASNGNVDWVRQIGGPNEDNGNAIACDPFGNVYFTGRFSGTVIFGTFTLTSTGGSDSFIAKLDPLSGTVLWAKKTGGTGNDGGLSITSDALGNIYTSGYFQGIATFGTFTLSPVGTNYNIFLARTDGTSGNVVWAKGYGSAGYSFGTSVSCGIGGDVFMTGYFESDVAFETYTLSSVKYQDIFVSKHYGSTGSVAWAYSAGGEGNDNSNGIVTGSDGYVYTTGKFEEECTFGTTTLTSEGSADIFVSKRDALTGSLAWVKRFGAAGYEQANAIVQDASGNIFITGQFNGFVTFGNKVLASSGNADVFVIQMETATGSVPWAINMGGSNVDSGYGISTGPANALYCTGFFQSNANFPGYVLTSKGSSDIFIMKLNSTTVGIDENNILYSSFQIMPLPFHDEVIVSIHKTHLKPYSLFLTDVSGKVIMELVSDQSHQQMNLGFLSPGIYFITLREENGIRAVKKVVKQ